MLARRHNSDQEEEEQAKKEEQGQTSTRQISQHDKYTLIEVRPPPRFTIPYQEERSWCTTIECTIGQRIFHNTFYDIGSGVNIISKVTYEYLFGDEPLIPTYMQL